MAKTVKRPLNNSPVYQNFVLARDRALEKLHSRAQHELTDSLGGALQRVMEIISYWYSRSNQSHILLIQLDHQISQVFHQTQTQMVGIVKKLRRQSYALASAGEAEAMARALTKPLKVTLNRARVEKAAERPMPSGGSVEDRVKLYLDRIKRKILDAVQLGAINEEPLSDLQARVLRTFPEVKHVKRAPKNIYEPKLREADQGDDYVLGYQTKGQKMEPAQLSTGFIDDDVWDEMLDGYLTDYIPKWRGPDGELDIQLGEGTPRYAWELEREMTQDFVQQVRNGEVDAANENGINDFIWIAVVDNRTDDCCLWRDGLTSSEIELALRGDHGDDDCEAINPPAHFNCRCRLAPAVDKMPEQPDLNIGDFTAWLDQTNS